RAADAARRQYRRHHDGRPAGPGDGPAGRAGSGADRRRAARSARGRYAVRALLALAVPRRAGRRPRAGTVEPVAGAAPPGVDCPARGGRDITLSLYSLDRDRPGVAETPLTMRFFAF